MAGAASASRSRFFCFMRRFWNQTFTWASRRRSERATSRRRALDRYRLKWNSFSSSVSCRVLKLVRAGQAGVSPPHGAAPPATPKNTALQRGQGKGVGRGSGRGQERGREEPGWEQPPPAPCRPTHFSRTGSASLASTRRCEAPPRGPESRARGRPRGRARGTAALHRPRWSRGRDGRAPAVAAGCHSRGRWTRRSLVPRLRGTSGSRGPASRCERSRTPPAPRRQAAGGVQRWPSCSAPGRRRPPSGGRGAAGPRGTAPSGRRGGSTPGPWSAGQHHHPRPAGTILP